MGRSFLSFLTTLCSSRLYVTPHASPVVSPRARDQLPAEALTRPTPVTNGGGGGGGGGVDSPTPPDHAITIITKRLMMVLMAVIFFAVVVVVVYLSQSYNKTKCV